MRNALLALTFSLLGSSALAGTPSNTYYVDPAGSDSNSGADAAHAWQTTSKVNGYQFNPGDRILFLGGSTISGNLAFNPNNRGTDKNPIIISTYGAGKVTFTVDAGNNCISVIDAAGYDISNVTCNGAGIGVSSKAGIMFSNSAATAIQLNTIKIDNVLATGFNSDALAITPAASRKGGYKNITITNFSSNLNGGSGIDISADGPSQNLGNVQTSPSFSNVFVNNAILSNDNFDEIYLDSVDTGTFQNLFSNVNNTGNGYYSNDNKNLLFQFFEVTNTTGFGLDFDLSTTNSTAQYFYIHNPTSLVGGNSGIELCNCGGSATHDITIRFGIIENVNQVTGTDVGDILILATTANMTNIFIYNVDIYESSNYAGMGVIVPRGAQIASLTGKFVNNAIYADVSVPSIIDTATTTVPAGFAVTGNYLYMKGSFQIKWNNVTYSTLAAWQTASSQTSNVNADPKFTNPGANILTNGYSPLLLTSYLLQAGSPMIGAGQNLNTLMSVDLSAFKDYYGNAAIGPSGYDLGAHSK